MKEYYFAAAFLAIFGVIWLMMRRIDRVLTESRRKKQKMKNSRILGEREE